MLIANYKSINKKSHLKILKRFFFGDSFDDHSLIELVDYHNTTQASVLAQGTMKNYYTTKRYLLRFFQKRFKSSDIYLVQVNYKFIVDFEYFLRNYKPLDHQKPLGNNGVMKHQERFRKMINLGQRLGWITQKPFDSYKLSFRKVNRGFLTEKELHAIENKVLEFERLQTVRDVFVFSCYTGIADKKQKKEKEGNRLIVRNKCPLVTLSAG
jgi:hypothetical protein